MIKKSLLIMMAIGITAHVFGQDPMERHYLYPALKPQHENKPKVTGYAQERVVEKFNRGIVAVHANKGQVYVGWRLLTTDSPETAFNVYRSIENGKAVKLNSKPIITTTDFIDKKPVLDRESSYWIRPVINGKELEASEKTLVKADTPSQMAYKTIKFQGDYMPQKIAVGDLNGDGEYDFVIKQPNQSIDPGGNNPNTDGTTYKLEAYLSDGTFLWRVDLGLGIEPGIWYSPYVVFDFDGDGKAEVAVKTAPNGKRDPDGRVRSGEETVSILDGMTGKEITSAPWPKRDPRYGNYNRLNRHQMGIAFLDGKTPSLLLARGTYKLMTLDAYQFHNDRLEQQWHWDGDEENPIIRHQGAHSMHAADVDGDGRDEVVLGAVVIDDNGTALWSTGYGHPDKVFVTDIDPTRPGLEIAYIQEDWNFDGNGVNIVDAKTGEKIWGIGHNTYHVGSGMVADIDPSIPGLEFFAGEDPKGNGNGKSSDKYLLSAQGKYLARNEGVPKGMTNWVFWDGDLLREEVVSQRGSGAPSRTNWSLSVTKYNGSSVTDGIEGSIKMIADIYGDWREELITVLPGEMRIYTTTIPAEDRRETLMQDPFYRNGVAHRSMGYDQSPVTSYYLGVSAEDAHKYEPIQYPPIIENNDEN
jgi:rhamnogalacturonan endolyase